MQNHYDLIVIGGGPGGYPAAIRAAKAGKRVAVAEASYLGGTCLNRGCIPTKTLLHTSELCRDAAKLGGAGLSAPALGVDMSALMEHKRQVISSLRDGIAMQFKKYKIDLYPAKAQVAGEGRVRLLTEAREELTAERILIAAGSEPAPLPIPGLELPGVENSTTLLEREKLYSHLVIIGGGVIGMEFATFYTDLGRQVTVLEAMDRILPGMEKEISQNLKMILKKRGAKIHTGAALESVRQGEDGGLVCSYREKDALREVSCDGVLVAVGRRGMAEESFDPGCRDRVAINRGYLAVNGEFETSLPGVYAVGDVIGGIQLAHVATAQGYCALRHMFGDSLGPHKDLGTAPSCVYTDPEIACAGLTAEEAKAAGFQVKTVKYLMSQNGKSLLSMQERGFVKLVAEEGTGRLLGAQLMCARATDIIGEACLAISRGITAEELARVIHPHPTFCEGFGEAAEELAHL